MLIRNLSHAQFDGSSLLLIVRDLAALYKFFEYAGTGLVPHAAMAPIPPASQFSKVVYGSAHDPAAKVRMHWARLLPQADVPWSPFHQKNPPSSFGAGGFWAHPWSVSYSNPRECPDSHVEQHLQSCEDLTYRCQPEQWMQRRRRPDCGLGSCYYFRWAA